MADESKKTKQTDDEPKHRKTSAERRAERQARNEEVRDIWNKRKEMRKDLRLNGIKGRADTEFFAQEVGLDYPKGTFMHAVTTVSAGLSRMMVMIKASITIKSVLAILAAILAATFLVAYISEEKGHFTINLTADMLREGFQISTTPDFATPSTRLFAEEIANSNATSVYEINRNVNEIDGSHNGPGYMAYTFYLRNNGTETTNYGYTVNILSETMGTGNAAWVMFFEDDKQIIYARAPEEGKRETLWGYPRAPFEDTAYYPDQQYKLDDGKYSIITTPFIDKETALQGYVKDFGPGDVKKYTCVVWLEGDDPDCNNKILGGHVGFNVQFERLGDDETGYFKGLFRREYNEYFEGNIEYDYGDQYRENEFEAHSPEEAESKANDESKASTKAEDTKQ